ncbi:GntR family transcriptional regulator [Amycolatopsis rhabdoformis]|uniref:GntR family transcriptional regulator n=1 Tax=Amycolatopsis rhabdoformis TaxID=1448059 RepID=A0ABZ1HY62_9PSEU|nr:GntR family transcriptional regulator [Amycolatopsis rhabdoformis]WSE26318.1 GntR family transcriptional regulator [Amycolatopsis rhabdoformis]
MSDAAELSEDYLGQQAYQALRRALRDGGISPGRFYSEAEFAELLGVSRTPVREALKALERDGVVVAARRRGYRIREFTEAEVDEIAALREQLEILVARSLTAQQTPEGLARLADILRRQDEGNPDETMFALDEEFHLTAAELAGLPRTRKILEGLRSVMAAVTAGVAVPHEESKHRISEHHAILAGIAAGDAEEAVRLMREHVRASDKTFRDAIRAAAAAGPIIKPLNWKRATSPSA